MFLNNGVKGAGSVSDPEGKDGLSYLLGQMLLRGTEYKNKEQDATIRADFTKQMGLFEIYYSNTGSYDGYCNSITNNSYTCKTFGDKGGYLMYTKLNNNKYFCIDNGYEFKELEKEPFGKTCAE